MECYDELAIYSEKRFLEIKEKIEAYLIKLGFAQSNIQMVPVSGF